MTISSVVDIVHGELLNTPSINRVEQVRVDAKKVKRGDLFISLFGNEIDTAIENGAYAVIVPKNYPVKDDETAWIGVEDTNLAMLHLLRYLLVKRDIRFIHCEEPLCVLATALLGRNRSVMILDRPVFHLVDTLIEREEIAYCFSHDRAMLETLASDVETMPLTEEPVTVLKASLFHTEMAFRGMRYSFPVASRLSRHLASLIVFCEANDLEFGWSLGGVESVFRALYLTRELRLSTTPTERVIIIDRAYSNAYVAESEAFLNENFRWGKVILFSTVPKEGTRVYTSAEELRSMLKTERFHYAYVLSDDPEALIDAFSRVSTRSDAVLF